MCPGYQRFFLACGGRKFFALLRRPKTDGRDMTDTGNCARKTSGTQGTIHESGPYSGILFVKNILNIINSGFENF